MNKRWLLVPAAILAVVTVTVMLPSTLVTIWPSHASKTSPQKLVQIPQTQDTCSIVDDYRVVKFVTRNLCDYAR